jgi:hypothetical protein
LDVIIFLTNWDEFGLKERHLKRSWIVNWLDGLPQDERLYHYLMGGARFVYRDATRGLTTRSKWQASLNTKYLFKLDRGRLNVKGVIFDHLTGLSSAYSGLPGTISSAFPPELQNL